MRQMVISGIRPSFPGLSRNQGQVTHVLLTRSPLIHPDASIQASAFDLHVLSTQPAFVLSQDQTLHKKIMLQYESQQDSQPDHGGDRSWPKIVSPEKQSISGITTSSNKHAIGFSNHKHTPITATQTRPRTLGASASLSPPHNPNRTRVRPGQTRQKPCSSNHVPGGATRYNSRPDQNRRATRTGSTLL